MNSKVTTLTLLILLYLSRISFAQDYNKTHTYKNNNGVSNTELEYRGKIVFTEDEMDVKSISPGGFLRFSKRSFGTKRTIILEGESNNVIYREYREGSKKKPFEPDGKRWMGSVLPEIIRTTGIGAPERVQKFYTTGGIEAVITEIGLLNSNYIKRIYYNASFAIPQLKEAEFAQLIASAGVHINSSYELSQLLIENSKYYTNSPKAMQAAVEVGSKISSSYEQAKYYKYLLNKANLTDSQKGKIIKNVRNISSSYEKSGVLQSVLKGQLSKENIALIVSEIAYINSSYEQSNVLRALIKSQSAEELNFETLLPTISKINSSYEQGKVLNQLVTTKKLSKEQLIKITGSTTFISSSYEKSKFLKKLITEQTLDEAGLNAVITNIGHINSSYEQSSVLQLAIGAPGFGGGNFKTAIKQVSKVSSSYEQSKILSKLITLKIPNTNQMAIINTIDAISSSYEKGKRLLQLAPQLSTQKEVQDAFYKAAESLSNDDYGKIMRALRN